MHFQHVDLFIWLFLFVLKILMTSFQTKKREAGEWNRKLLDEVYMF